MAQVQGAAPRAPAHNSVRYTEAKTSQSARVDDDKRHTAPPPRGQARFVVEALAPWIGERSVQVLEPGQTQTSFTTPITQLRQRAPVVTNGCATDATAVSVTPPLRLDICPLDTEDAPAAQAVAKGIAQASEASAGKPFSTATLQGLAEQVRRAVVDTASNIAWLFGTLVNDAGGASLNKAQLATVLRVVMSPASDRTDHQMTQALRSIAAAMGDELPTHALEAFVECIRDSALQRDGSLFLAQCAHAFNGLSALLDTRADDPRERPRLGALLDAVVSLQESAHDWPVVFASWFALAQKRLGADEALAFTRQRLPDLRACSPAVVMYLSGRIAANGAQAALDQPEEVHPRIGALVNQLIRLDALRAAAGLSGVAQTLREATHFGPRQRCELLQAIAALKDVIDEHGAAGLVRVFLDELAGESGFGRAEAAAILASLRDQCASSSPPPERDVAQTLSGLWRGMLAPGMSPVEVAHRLPDLRQVLQHARLSNDAVQEIGRGLVEALDGKAINPGTLEQLALQCAHAGLPVGRSGALLQGMIQGAGGPDIGDAQLQAIGRAIGAVPVATGAALTVHLAAATDAFRGERPATLLALLARLQGVLGVSSPDKGDEPAPASGPSPALALGLRLCRNPIAALAPHALPDGVAFSTAQALDLFEETLSIPDLLDDATLGQQILGASLWAARDLDAALQAIARLPDSALARVGTVAFGPLLTALHAQAIKEAAGGALSQARAGALAAVYARFVEHGRLDETATPASGHKGPAKAGPVNWAVVKAQRVAAQQAFLKEAIARIGRGAFKDAQAPLHANLEALNKTLGARADSKR